MDTVTIKLKGTKGATRAIEDYAKGKDREIERILLQAGFKIEAHAKRRVPVDTGRLRASITTQGEHESWGYVVRVGTNVIYAVYVEFGTRRMAARPYLLPAYQLYINDVKKSIKIVFSK